MHYLGNISVVGCLAFIVFNYVNVFLNIKITKKQLFYIAAVLLVLVSLIAINTKPDVQDDLTRHFEHLRQFSKKGFDYLKDFPYTANLITVALFMLVAQTGWNNLLPLIVTIVFYIAVFTYISKQKEVDKRTRYLSLYVVVFASFVYLNETISGVRFPLAIATFLLVYTFDKNKVLKLNFKDLSYNLLYLLPVLVHQTTILLTIVMFTSKISQWLVDKQKMKNKQTKFRLEYLLVIVPYFGLLLSLVVPKGIPLVSGLLERLRIYADPSFYLQFFDWRVEACMLILFGVISYLFIKNRHLIKKRNGNFYYMFYKSLLIFCLGILPFPVIFTRFLTLVTVMSFPVLQTISVLPKRQKQIIVICLLVVSSGLFAYRMVNAFHYWRFY